MKRSLFSLLFLFVLLISACGDDDDTMRPAEPMVRVVNNLGLDLTDVVLDEAVDFGNVAIGATTDYLPHPDGDACSLSLVASAGGARVEASQICIVADPLVEGATYTLTLLDDIGGGNLTFDMARD